MDGADHAADAAARAEISGLERQVVLLESEVVAELVQNRLAHLLDDLAAVAGDARDRAAVNHDAVRQAAVLETALAERSPLIEAACKKKCN